MSIQAKQQNKRKDTVAWLLILFLMLFLFSSIILGSRLYDIATRDKYVVDLGMGHDGEIELFKVQYENTSGEITVQGANGENVIAPGTTVDYAVRLRNRDDVVIDFALIPQVEYLNQDSVPIHFKLRDNYGNYVLGDENTWVDIAQLNNLIHKGSIHPGEVFTYYLSWEWIFEVSEDQDAYDTYLGNQEGQEVPGVSVTLTTESIANPVISKHSYHTMHLLGEGMGCCWCCWLVWALLLVVVLILFWNWRIRRKLYAREDMLKEYAEVLQRHGLLAEGKLVEREHV